MKVEKQTRTAHSLGQALSKGIVTLVFAAVWLAPCVAQQGPKPDPAGIATGDKTNAVDAGGTAFVVSEPTDKTAPTYEKSKKDFDEYQAQAAKEPLAVKLADSVGHIPLARQSPAPDLASASTAESGR